MVSVLDRYYYAGNCPICGQKLERFIGSFYWSANCKSKCFEIHFIKNNSRFTLRFFDSERLHARGDKALTIYNEKVNYWKENDRYLAEFLTRS